MAIRFSEFWIVVILLILGSNSFAAEKPLSLDQGWEYRWGDSPVSADGVPVWTVEPESASDWHAIDFPSNPPGRSVQSYEDSLTGLKNRRFFDEFFSFHASTALRTGLPLTLAMCDLDYFKQFNDTYGHPAGDTALKLFADLLKDSFREIDLVCRLGGEEFVIVIPNTGHSEAKEKIQALLNQAGKQEIYHEGRSCGYVSASAGVASCPEQTDDPYRLIVLADAAMYTAKKSRAKSGGRVKGYKLCLQTCGEQTQAH